MTYVVHSAGEKRVLTEFERDANLAVDRVVTRLLQHVVVLRAARGFLSASGGRVDRREFVSFLSSVDIVDELSGVQGIGFARMLAADETAAAQREIMNQYGLELEVRPPTQQAWRTPIVLLEPATARNLAALGYDMYADRTRRLAMDHAIASGEARMSGPVELVQEISPDKQAGFLIYLPFPSNNRPPGTQAAPVAGFVYAPFRAGDLITAALETGTPLPVVLRVVDTGAPDRPLFDGIATAAGADPRLLLGRTAEILGRQWAFEMQGTGAASGVLRYLGSALLGLTSLLFATAAAYAVAFRQKEAIQARAVAAAAARESDYRELLLQEMKHRIKNHIARIQSIARQSARGATDVKAFIAAFDARLQAMSAVQEILAGTVSAQADVRAILVKELQQCLDTAEVEHLLDGPVVTLDERQAHAFAMVAHELVTNAMKYGGLSAAGMGLKITWAVRDPVPGGAPRLELTWLENVGAGDWALTNGGPSHGPGFGSRLIEASLKGELSGTIRRDFGPEGLRISLEFPLTAALNPRRR